MPEGDDDATPIDGLAPLPAAQRGESAVAGSFFSVSVSNAGEDSGFLCAIAADAVFPALHPGSLYAIFTHPRNDGIFRDIKYVRERRVLLEEEERLEDPLPASAPAAPPPARRRAGLFWGGGEATTPKPAPAPATPKKAAVVVFRKVEVEQVGELRILMARREFGTRLVVEEDARRAASDGIWQTRFSLVQSDALSKFQGSWTITAIAAEEGARDVEAGGGKEEPRQGDNGAASAAATSAAPLPAPALAPAVAGCRCHLEQQVLPRGVPVFFQRVPVLGALLRRVSLGAVERLMRDLQEAAAALAESAPEAAAGGDEAAVHAALDAMRRARLMRGEGKARGEGERRAAGTHLASHAPSGRESGEEDDEDEDEDEDEDDDEDEDGGDEER